MHKLGLKLKNMTKYLYKKVFILVEKIPKNAKHFFLRVDSK